MKPAVFVALAACAAGLSISTLAHAENATDCEIILKAAQNQTNALLRFQMIRYDRAKSILAGKIQSGEVDDELEKAGAMVEVEMIRAFVPAFRRLCPETAAKLLSNN